MQMDSCPGQCNELEDKLLKYEQAFTKKYESSGRTKTKLSSQVNREVQEEPRPASACSEILGTRKLSYSNQDLIEKYLSRTPVSHGAIGALSSLDSNFQHSAHVMKYTGQDSQKDQSVVLNVEGAGSLASRNSLTSTMDSNQGPLEESKILCRVRCSKAEKNMRQGDETCSNSGDETNQESHLENLALQLEAGACVTRNGKRSKSDLGFMKKHLPATSSVPSMSRTQALLNNPILQKYLTRTNLGNPNSKLKGDLRDSRLFRSTISLPVMDDYSPETSPREELELDPPNPQMPSNSTPIHSRTVWDQSADWEKLNQTFCTKTETAYIQLTDYTPGHSRLTRGKSLGNNSPVPSLDLSSVSDESQELNMTSVYATPRFTGGRSCFNLPSFREFKAMRKSGRLTPIPISPGNPSSFFDLDASDIIKEEPEDIMATEGCEDETMCSNIDPEKSDKICINTTDFLDSIRSPEVRQVLCSQEFNTRCRSKSENSKEESGSKLPPTHPSTHISQKRHLGSHKTMKFKEDCNTEKECSSKLIHKTVDTPLEGSSYAGDLVVNDSCQKEAFHLVSEGKLNNSDLQVDPLKVSSATIKTKHVSPGKSRQRKLSENAEELFVAKVKECSTCDTIYCDTLRTVPETTFPTNSVTTSRGQSLRKRSSSDSQVQKKDHIDKHYRSKSFSSEGDSEERPAARTLKLDTDSGSSSSPCSQINSSVTFHPFVRPPRSKDKIKLLTQSSADSYINEELGDRSLKARGNVLKSGEVLRKSQSMGVLQEDCIPNPVYMERTNGQSVLQSENNLSDSKEEQKVDFYIGNTPYRQFSEAFECSHSQMRWKHKDQGYKLLMSLDSSENTSDLGDEMNRSREVSPINLRSQNALQPITDVAPVVRSTSDVSDKKSEEFRKKATRSRRAKLYNSDPFHAIRRQTIAEEPSQLPVKKLSARERIKLRAARRERRMIGSTKEEILTFLQDAKSDGVSRMGLRCPSMHSLRTGFDHDIFSEDGPFGSEVERVDSGVGSEIKGSTSQFDDTVPRCEDCEGNLNLPEEYSEMCFEAILCKKCEAQRTERKEAIQEVVDTEISYGNDLRIIKEEFYIPMKTAQLLTSEQLQTIFINLEELITINDRFADLLQDSLDLANEQGDEDYTSVNIGQLFLESTSMLQAFETYCINQSTAPLLLEQLEREKELLRVFLQVSQTENSVLRRMNLKSFLMVPLQRVTKYPLLLSRVYRSSPEHNEDREAVRQAQGKIEHILEHINSKAKDNMVLRLKRKFSGIRKHGSGTSTENVLELNKLSIEVLQWDRYEANTLMTGRLQYMQPQDHLWTKKGRSLKFTPIYALLLTLGKAGQIEQTRDLMFARPTRVREAALVLYKEKGEKFILLGEPLGLDKCVVSMDPDSEEVFEVLETSREVHVFKGSNLHETFRWYQGLRIQAKDLGQWRRRRNALANIMIHNMAAKP